ncbi:MAG: hypothetical protein IKR85_06205 [Clostridia bacterium]|nr:hypothetical protein [Clostridia bacterium]
MKKLLCGLLMLALALSMAYAEDTAETVVYVSIANGTLMTALAPVSVSDIDEDGALTINDALYLAHELYFEGGDGYASAMSDWGLSLTKLWGVENGGSYGYYVNNVSAMSLADPVQDGDTVYAFVYTDTAAWSDTFCYFDAEFRTAGAGDEVTLTLCAAGFDENWTPVTLPVAGAVITINGEATEYVTDETARSP